MVAPAVSVATAPAKPAPLFLGAALWLDLINTVLVAPQGPVDLIESSAESLEWLAAAGLISRRQVRLLSAQAATLHHEMLALRAALRPAADALMQHRAVLDASIEAVNRVLQAGIGYSRLDATADGHRMQFVPTADSPLSLLIPIARSVAELLDSGDPTLIKHCDGPGCVLLFYDTTKNHRRRFCSTEVCGNRVKVAAHYLRKREAARIRISP